MTTSSLSSSAQAAVADVPRSRWPWPAQVGAAVVGLILATVVAVLLGVALSGLGLSQDDPAVAVLLSLTLMVAATGLVALAARLDGRRRLADLIGRVGAARHLTGLLAGMTISVVVVLGVGMATTAAGLTRAAEDESSGLPLAAAVVVGLAHAFALQGVPEELLFRGYLLRSLRCRPWVAVAASAVAFGVLHLASNGGQVGWGERVAYLALPTGFALTAGALVVATGSLASAIGIHAGLHVALLFSGLLAPTVPALRLGDGPVLWVATGVVFAAAAVAIMVRRRRSDWIEGGLTPGRCAPVSPPARSA